MDRQPIIGAVVGMFAGGSLGILALTEATNGKLVVALGFAGGMIIVGSLFMLVAASRS